MERPDTLRRLCPSGLPILVRLAACRPPEEAELARCLAVGEGWLAEGRTGPESAALLLPYAADVAPARALRRFTRAENTRGGWVVACYTALTFCYSGEAALLPALCTDRFGLPHAGINYGFLALGMSAGSLGFPLLARLWGLEGGRHWLAAGAAALGALCLTALPEAPQQPGRPAAKKAEGPGRR